MPRNQVVVADNNNNASISGSFTAGSIIRSGGLATQFLMANGSVSTNPGWITGYTETDTLATVTARGASTSTTLSLARVITTGLYGPSTSGNIPIWQYDANNPGYGIVYFESSPDLLRIDVSGQALSGTPDFLIGPDYAQVNGNTVWHAGNLTNLNQLTNGPGYITSSGSITGSAGSATQVVTLQDNPPSGVNGQLWFETDTLRLKVYSSASSAWIDSFPMPDMSLYYTRAGGAITGSVVIQQDLTVNGQLSADGILKMNTTGTSYIRMGRFPASTTNSGEAWIGRASDRSVGTMTVQLGTASDRVFEVVDNPWSTVIFSAGMSSFSYKGNTIWHAGNDGVGSGLDADLLDGFGSSTSSTANTIALRDTNGDIAAREFVLTASTIHTTTPSSLVGIFPTTNQVVKVGDTAARAYLNVPTRTGGDASGTWGINITGSAGSASSASSVPWAGISAGVRTNYTLRFQPSSNDYAGFEFNTSTGGGAGYFLVRGTSDNDVYTAEGITLVADAGWLTLAQRTSSSRGVRIMTGTGSTERARFLTDGTIQFVNGAGFTYNGNTIWHAGNLTNLNQLTNGPGYITGITSGNVTSALGYTPMYQAAQSGVNVNAFNGTGLYRGSTGDWTNRPTVVHNGGALLQIDTHPGNYHQQLFFDTGGNRLYMRSADAGTWGSWVTMWHSGNLTNLNQLTNGPGYITGYTETDTLNSVSSRGNTIDTRSIRFTNASGQGIRWDHSSWTNNAFVRMDNNFDLRIGGHNTISFITNHLNVGDVVRMSIDMGGTVSIAGTLNFTDSTNGISKSGTRLTIRSESTDNVANFADYGLYLPRTGQTAGLYVESPIEARGGLRIGGGAASGTINVGADTGVAGNRLVQRDGNGYIYANYINFNTSESENPSINSFFTSNGDGWSRKSSLQHVKNSIRGVADGTWGINISGSADSSTFLNTQFLGNGSVNINSGRSTVLRNETGSQGNLNYAPILHLAASDTMWQIQGDYYNSSTLRWRAGYQGTWYSWREIVHSGNISSQPVVTIQDAPPSGVNGQLWWESDTGKLKVYYGAASAWIDATAIPDMTLYYPKAGGVITGDVTVRQTFNVVGNTLLQANANILGTVYSAAYRGNANVGGTGEATWHPAGIYCGGTLWQYGDQYKNNTWIYNLAGTTMSGPIRRTAHVSGWLEGSYNSVGANDSKSNPIYTIGSSYNPGESSTGNMYGIGYAHPNFWGGGKVAGWGMYVANNGTIDACIGGDSTSSVGIWSRLDIVAYSDARVKENVEIIQDALEKVKAIRGVTFTRNDIDDKEKRHCGVIAQEVLAVMPELVTGDEESRYSVAYGNMTGLLIEAIKEQQNQISELKNLVNILTDKLNKS